MRREKRRKACAIAMYKANLTCGSSERDDCGGASDSRAALEGGLEVGLRREAERNMSCQGGVEDVDGLFGSEYGTNSMNYRDRNDVLKKILIICGN